MRERKEKREQREGACWRREREEKRKEEEDTKEKRRGKKRRIPKKKGKGGTRGERRVQRVAFEKEVLIWTSSKRVIKTGLEVR